MLTPLAAAFEQKASAGILPLLLEILLIRRFECSSSMNYCDVGGGVILSGGFMRRFKIQSC